MRISMKQNTILRIAYIHYNTSTLLIEYYLFFYNPRLQDQRRFFLKVDFNMSSKSGFDIISNGLDTDIVPPSLLAI